MDTWGKTPSRRRYGYGYGNGSECEHPSFSSTLLEAIYRSIDEGDGVRAEQRTGGGPYRAAPLTATRKKPAVAEKAVTRIGRRGFPNSTSSSSDGSSYGGFSSSEAESNGIRRIRTVVRSDPVRSPPVTFHRQEKSKNSIRSKIRELRKSKTPSSPGARIASFLNSIFTPRKGKSAAATSVGGGLRRADESSSACSTASSYTRSCLSKTPSTRSAVGAAEKRTVRFYPVSVIVDEERRPCGQKRIYGGEEAMEAKKKVEEIMRIRRLEEEEEDEEESDASSDLFELENLAVIGNGGGEGGGGYRDELPVYETTSLGTNRAIAHGLIR